MRSDVNIAGNPEGDGISTAGQTDRLLYVADLLGELETLVRQEGYATLEGLLALSQAEARRLAKAVPSSA